MPHWDPVPNAVVMDTKGLMRVTLPTVQCRCRQKDSEITTLNHLNCYFYSLTCTRFLYFPSKRSQKHDKNIQQPQQPLKASTSHIFEQRAFWMLGLFMKWSIETSFLRAQLLWVTEVISMNVIHIQLNLRVLTLKTPTVYCTEYIKSCISNPISYFIFNEGDTTIAFVGLQRIHKGNSVYAHKM